MQTDAFIAEVAGNGNVPGHLATPDDELRAYAAAVRIAASLGPRIAKHTASPTHASYYALLAEQAQRTAAHAQILAADLAQRTLVHELPVAQLNGLRALAKDPEDYISGATRLPDDPRTVPAGRPTFKNTIDFLQNLLHISFFEARDRLQSATNLLPHTDVNGFDLPPKFPKLADELVSGDASPREIGTAAKKLDALGPHINQQPDPVALSTELEDQVLESVRTQDPRTTRRLLSSIQSSLEQGITQPSEEVLRSRLGLFYRGMNSGTAEFLLRMLPGDAEFVLSLCAQTDNPRTKAGDRAGLLKQSPFGTSPREGLVPDPGSKSSAAQGNRRAPGSEPADASRTTYPDFLLAASPTHDKPLATPEELAAITLGNEPVQYLPQATTPTPDPFEVLNQGATGADGLTPPQRHLQGLLNLLKSNGMADKKSTGLPSPDMVIIATLAELEERASTSCITRHGQRLSAAELRQHLCNCRAIPIVMNGKSRILDLGRSERYFPDYMRRAILARDGGCVVPGCTVPPEHCEIHHLKPWELGGLTRVEDGTPACSGHHHAVHAGLIEIVHNEDGLPAAILPAFMDPGQQPRRNTYWNRRPTFTAPTLF
ncbi:HNH endonuclease signature motif containing protein [Paeniglutamicibacter sp. NPDC012692]|uniref:HNH endonuclease signature motif containing protein n=1 Tax=Paeniglutamicibacter sp. NPDC012692 TaxID=3364388 RepID=UPI00367AF313